MSLRCAVCGSRHVTLETKKEGYDLKKGVIGTALVGIPGALAGVNGKENTYYHCADCGHVLNKCMDALESIMIDNLLKEPSKWKEELKVQKAKYINIEWEEEIKKGADVAQREYPQEKNEYQLVDEVLFYLYKKGGSVEYKQLVGIFGDSIKLQNVLNELTFSGQVAFENSYCRLVTDEDEKEKLIYTFKARNDVKEDVCSNFYQYIKMLLAHVEIGKIYTEEEIDEIQNRIFDALIVTDNPYYLKEFNIRLRVEALKQCILFNDNNIWGFRTLEEAKMILEKEDKEHREKIEKPNRVIEEKILKFLNEHPYETFTIREMQDRDKRIAEHSDQKLFAILKRMEERKVIDKIKKKGKIYYTLSGLSKRLEEKQRLEEQQKRERLERENIEYTNRIEQCEIEKTQLCKIVEENKNKIFGAGAKAKKEATEKINVLNNEIVDLKKRIENNMNTLEKMWLN